MFLEFQLEDNDNLISIKSENIICVQNMPIGVRLELSSGTFVYVKGTYESVLQTIMGN